MVKPKNKRLRADITSYLEVLGVRIDLEHLDETIKAATKNKDTHLEVLSRFLSSPAKQKRERSTDSRIKRAKFDELCMLESFDWSFNANAIDESQMRELATADFVERKDNIVFVGQSGLGKSHLIQAIGLQACAAGHSVFYTSSSALMADLTSALADQSLTARVKKYTRPKLLIIDEFGFDRIEREESPQAASLLYKVIDGRNGQVSTALVTNLDFDSWATYLGDAPLSMALLDRMVDNAIIVKFSGKSYRAKRARRAKHGAKPIKSKKVSKKVKGSKS